MGVVRVIVILLHAFLLPRAVRRSPRKSWLFDTSSASSNAR